MNNKPSFKKSENLHVQSFKLTDIFDNLISVLPRHSEEECSSYRVSKKKVITLLGKANINNHNFEPEVLICFIEKLLSSLSLLDFDELKNGYWKFVSHSAQLCALSILHTLADPKQKLFPSDFWHTNVGDAEKQQQKKVLQTLEDRRYKNHQDGTSAATPVRFVYVAWAIIKIDDKFLFHRREATEHDAEYGLVGGRAKLSDLRNVVDASATKEELLAILQSSASKQMFDALGFTLQRELLEEVGISQEEGHYEFEQWRDLKPYRKCMGAAPNYALTEYFFRLYSVQLTTTGYFALRDHMSESSNLLKCSLEEIATGHTSDNANSLRIEALYDDFGDKQTLVAALRNMDQSYSNRYRFTEENKSIIFSLDNDLFQGNSGKEKPLHLDNLSTTQKELLLALAIHGKGLPFELMTPEKVALHKFGWIEIRDNSLQNDLRQLSEKMRKHDSAVVEVTNTNYYRLSLNPDLIFFDSRFFTFRFDKSENRKGILTLSCDQINTTLGYLKARENQISVGSSLTSQLEKVLSSDGLHCVDAEDLPKKVRSSMQDKYQGFGLRRLLITKDSFYAFHVKRVLG